MPATAAFALLLFGCADDGTMCERIAYPAPTFGSTAHCEARVDDALTSNAANRADAPVVIARCVDAARAARIGAGTYDLSGPLLTPVLAVR